MSVNFVVYPPVRCARSQIEILGKLVGSGSALVVSDPIPHLQTGRAPDFVAHILQDPLDNGGDAPLPPSQFDAVVNGGPYLRVVGPPERFFILRLGFLVGVGTSQIADQAAPTFRERPWAGIVTMGRADELNGVPERDVGEILSRCGITFPSANAYDRQMAAACGLDLQRRYLAARALAKADLKARSSNSPIPAAPSGPGAEVAAAPKRAARQAPTG